MRNLNLLDIFTGVTIVNSQETVERIRKERNILKANMKYLFMGTPEEIKEKIKEAENLGINKMVIAIVSPDIEDPIDIFSREIM
ncbi:MAG: hypothetical protein ACFFB0_02070 [Promethearchaeota archaeon]